MYTLSIQDKSLLRFGGGGVDGRELPKLTVENRRQTKTKKNSAKIQLGFNVPSD